MRSLLFPAVALALLASCSPGNNSRRTASTDTTGASSETGMAGKDTTSATGAKTSMTAAAIFSQLYAANTTEIALAKRAEQKAKSPAVKRIAGKLAADHAKNRTQLEALAKKMNVSLPSAAGGAVADTAMPQDLLSKTGADFDKGYIEHEIQGHQSNIDKLQNQMIPAATDPEVKSYLQTTLKEMENHLAMLQKVQKQLGSG